MTPLSFKGVHFFSIKRLAWAGGPVVGGSEGERKTQRQKRQRKKDTKDGHNSMSNSCLKDSFNSRF